MILVGCDFHSRYQQIACVETDTGDLVERRLKYENGEARAFYSSLQPPARVGVEATGNLQWFGRMLAEFGHELIVGDAAKIRAMVVRRQKTDSRDASHLLDLLMNNRFPEIWVPTRAENDLRQLLWHRQKLVWMRTSVKNQTSCPSHGPRKFVESQSCGTRKGGRRLRAWRSIRGPAAAVMSYSAYWMILIDRATQSFSGGGWRWSPRRSSLNDPPRRRAHCRTRIRAYGRTSSSFSQQQASRELFRTESD